MRDKIIRICWSDPLPLDEAIPDELAKTQGLYYITRVFGAKETSLYLGIATRGNTVSNRLRSHRDKWLPAYRGQIYVRIGYVIYPRDYDAAAIDHAESALLYAPEHKKLFPENVAKRGSYSYSELYRIENEGNRFELMPTIRMHEQE